MKIAPLFICLYFFTANITAQSVPPQQDGSLFSLEVGNLSFTVDSIYGAKVSSLTLDGTEFMVTSDMASSDFLWGATLWPSPQSEWNWNNPNKLVWDHEEYTSSIEGDTMTFTGKEVSVDNGDSFYFIKNFWASSADTTLSMHYSMVNTTGKTIKKALWELTRVPVGGLTFWPTGPGGTWGDLAPATEEINDHTWYDRESEDGTGLKFFADGKDGWFAHVDDFGTLYIKTFEDVDRSEFANKEGEIELWVADEYIELENQSACRNIAANAQLDYEVKWYLRPLPAKIEATAGNMELVEYVKWVISDRTTPPTSLAPDNESLRAHIYPNPTKGTIHIKLSRSQQETIQYTLTDIHGKAVKGGELSAEILDISDMSSGIYLLTIQSGSFTGTKKIFKK
jgi:hypothetical protein